MDVNVHALFFRLYCRWIDGRLVMGIPGPWGFKRAFLRKSEGNRA